MYIDVEGISGSGKTVLAERVAARLARLGHRVTRARSANGGRSLTSRIAQLETEGATRGLHPRSALFLALAHQVQLLEDVVRPALRRGEICFTEGALFSQLALAGAGAGFGPGRMAAAFELADAQLPPDLIILVDSAPELARWRKLSAGEAPGAASEGAQASARATLRTLAARDPARWILVENEGLPLSVLEERVTEAILARREGRQAQVEPLLPRPISRPASGLADPVEAHFFSALDGILEREPKTALAMLTGLGGLAAMRRRVALLEQWPEAVAQSLTGVSGPEAQAMRELLVKLAPRALAASLIGAVGSWVGSMRARLFDAAPGEVVASLGGDDSEAAWALRERALAKGFEAEVLRGLTSLDGARAWRVRSAGLSRGWTAPVATSLTGLTGMDAETLRERLFADAPLEVIASTRGIASPHAASLRERLFDRAPGAVLRSLQGVTDAAAQALRERSAATCPEALRSLHGDDGEAAWKLRARFAAIWPEAALDSLGPCAHHERGRALTTRVVDESGHRLCVLRAAYAASQAPVVEQERPRPLPAKPPAVEPLSD
jgi:dTMP kinase